MLNLRSSKVCLITAAVFYFLATAQGRSTCNVSNRKAASLSEAQLLEVATLAFKGKCKIGEFPGLRRSIDPLCYTKYSRSGKGCRIMRKVCQRLLSADGSGLLAVSDGALAAIGLYFAEDGLNFSPVILAKTKKEIELVKDWAADSDDEGEVVKVECVQKFNVSLNNVTRLGKADLCFCKPKKCMTAETLAQVQHLKIRKYPSQKVLCHAGNCMTPQHNVLHGYGWETMESYCVGRECTESVADVYKAIVLGFSRRGGIVLSIVYGTGLERVATIVGQLLIWGSLLVLLGLLFIMCASLFGQPEAKRSSNKFS